MVPGSAPATAMRSTNASSAIHPRSATTTRRSRAIAARPPPNATAPVTSATSASARKRTGEASRVTPPGLPPNPSEFRLREHARGGVAGGRLVVDGVLVIDARERGVPALRRLHVGDRRGQRAPRHLCVAAPRPARVPAAVEDEIVRLAVLRRIGAV